MLVAGSVIVLVFLSIKSKMHNNYLRSEGETVINSPLAEAITELIGISGGIYLALLTAAEFIGLNGDYQVTLGGYCFNALALLAIFLSLIQPITVLLWRKIFHC